MRLLLIVLALLFASPAFPQSETDMLKLENLTLRIELLAREFRDLQAQRDALKAKIEAEAKAKAAEKKEAKGE